MDEELPDETPQDVILGLAAGSDPIDIAPLLRHDSEVVATVIAIRLLRAGHGSGVIDRNFWEVLEIAGIVGLTKHYVGQTRAATSHVLEPQRLTGPGGGGYQYVFTPTEKMILLSRHGTPPPEEVAPEPEDVPRRARSTAEVETLLRARVDEADRIHLVDDYAMENGAGSLAHLRTLLLEMTEREIHPHELAATITDLLGDDGA